MKKARIVTEQVGVKTFFYAEIQKPFLFFFKTWNAISHVDLSSGNIGWYKSLGTTSRAERVLMDYEELYGEKLDLIN